MRDGTLKLILNGDGRRRGETKPTLVKKKRLPRSFVRFKNMMPPLAKDLLLRFEPTLIAADQLDMQLREDLVAWVCYALRISTERLLPKEEYPQAVYYDDFVTMCVSRYNQVGRLLQARPYDFCLAFVLPISLALSTVLPHLTS